MINQLFNMFNWLGSEWVLIILVILSVVTLAVILQKAITLNKLMSSSQKFWSEKADGWFEAGRTETASEFEALPGQYPCLEARALAVVGRSNGHTVAETEKVISAYLDQQRMQLEKNVSILGTIGANAPFIGLLGTVLGIIRAFHDMAQAGISSGMDQISGGIAEALVATALGLFVAVPAVIFFNLLSKRIGLLIRRAQSVVNLALSQKK